MLHSITFDPNIMGGRACIRGMRIPVSAIVRQIAHGASFEEILEGCPTSHARTSSKRSSPPPGSRKNKCTRLECRRYGFLSRPVWTSRGHRPENSPDA